MFETQSRRDFVKQSSLLAGSLMMAPLASKAGFFNSSVDDTIKVALIGCGGRGTGAAMQALAAEQALLRYEDRPLQESRLIGCRLPQ